MLHGFTKPFTLLCSALRIDYRPCGTTHSKSDFPHWAVICVYSFSKNAAKSVQFVLCNFAHLLAFMFSYCRYKCGSHIATWGHDPKGRFLNLHRRENLKARIQANCSKPCHAVKSQQIFSLYLVIIFTVSEKVYFQIKLWILTTSLFFRHVPFFFA